MAEILNWFKGQLAALAHFVAPYTYELALIMVVCVIALYADDVNKITKRLVARRHFVVRTLVFVLVTAFGLGALTLFVTPWMVKLLTWFGTLWLPLTLATGFLVLGILADRKNQL